MGRDIDRVFSREVVSKNPIKSKYKKESYKKDMHKFTQTYKKSNLFKCILKTPYRLQGAFVNLIGNKQTMLLHKAVICRNLIAIKTFMELGVGINAKDIEGILH